jgi:hypothetical protein
MPDHEINVAVPLSVLQYMVARAKLAVTLLRNGCVWIGEEDQLEDLVAHLDDERPTRFEAGLQRPQEQVLKAVEEKAKLQKPEDEIDVVKALEEAAKKDQLRPRITFLPDFPEEEGGAVL